MEKIIAWMVTVLVGALIWYLKSQTKRQNEREDKREERDTKREEKILNIVDTSLKDMEKTVSTDTQNTAKMTASVKDLKEVVALSESDFKEFEVRQDDTQLHWNTKGNEEREIVIGEKATDIVIESLEKLDKESKLTERHFTLYEKFVKE